MIKENLNRIICAVLVVALLIGAGVAVSSGSRAEPENPLLTEAQALNADPMDAGSSSQQD